MAGAVGQSIDPALLQELQKRAGSAQGNTSSIDESREAAERRLLAAEREALLDQLRLAQELEKKKQPPTRIETFFSERFSDDPAKLLRQFGYDLFAHHDQIAPPITGRIADSYVLGVGDEVILSFQGAEHETHVAKVNREGMLMAGKLPPIAASGRTLADLRETIKARTKETLIGTEVFVSVGAVKSVSVLVAGEVENPGVYSLTSLSDALQALILAGGVKKTGSLRSIMLLRNGERHNIDLYDVIFTGGADILLQDGDRLIVPVLGGVFAIAGDVRRPAIYELPANQKAVPVSEALGYAGGTLAKAAHTLMAGRYDSNGVEMFEPISADKGETIGASDLVIATQELRRAQGRVTLSGWVTAPGARAVGQVNTLRDLLGGSTALRAGAYLPFAVLASTDPENNIRRYEAINLYSVINGRTDQPLAAENNLIVFGPEEIRFLSSDALRRVVLGEENPLPNCQALTRLSHIVRDTQSNRYSAVLRGILVSEAGEQAGDSTNIIRETSDRTAVDEQSGGLQGGQGREELMRMNEAREQEQQAIERRRRQLIELAQCPEIFESDPDVLQFTLEHVASITGAVRNPGVFPIADRLPAASLIAQAGSFSRDADLTAVEIISFFSEIGNDGVGAVRQIVDSTTTDLTDVAVTPGSGIQIRSRSDDQEAGGILLSGEFRRPGVYVIQSGERLSQIIARAGGLTDQAYPYGAVFTRRSVKLAQQEGFRRTGRELNAALVAAALKNNIDADAVKAARELAQAFASVEAPGRVVIEADPRVLALRPDLDPVVEPGDTITMPKRPNHVLAIGDVLNPGALQFIRGKNVGAYVAEAGGIQSSADKGRIFLVYPNGVAQPTTLSAWQRSRTKVPPGSTIVVPKDTDPLATLQLTSQLSTIVSQLALSAASFAVIFDNR